MRMEYFEVLSDAKHKYYRSGQILMEEQAERLEKIATAFIIVKRKSINVFGLKRCKNAEQYNNCISSKPGFVKENLITQEEFEFLFKMLAD